MKTDETSLITGNPTKWLLVDDNPTLLEILRQALTQLTSAEIFTFVSAEDAIEAFRNESWNFELVISDFDMPRMNGGEMLREIREIKPGIKSILMSGSPELSLETAQHLGFNAFLAKPFSFSAFMEAMEIVRQPDSLLQAA